MENAKICNNYNLDETIAKDYLAQFTYPWEALAGISDYIKELGPTLDKEIFEEVSENVWVAKSAKVAPTACLNGPLIIDEDAEIRHCAFIRGSAIVGKGSVVGNSTELKNVIKEIEEEIRELFKNSRVYTTIIPRSNKITEAQRAGKTIIEYAPTSPVATAYIELAKEVINDGKLQ